MFVYPEIDPIAFSVGPVKVHWYGLMYLAAFCAAWLLGNYRAKRDDNTWTAEHVSDLIFYGAVGVILGGRIGYMLFYDLPGFLHNPLSLFKIWTGGMSFHGGLIGVGIALYLFARRYQKAFFDITDFAVPLVPLGLGFGRLGNFINGELWGQATQVPWAMVFPYVDNSPRHPSQLYEFLLEGVILFTIMWLYSAKPRPRMAVTGLFFLCYGAFRIFAEFFRQPDPQYGFLAFGWLTMGQILSIPMVLLGAILLYLAYQKHNEE